MFLEILDLKIENIPYPNSDETFGILKNINGDSSYIYVNEGLQPYKIVITENLDNYEVPIDSIALVLCNDGAYLKVSKMYDQVFEYNNYEYFKDIDLSDSSIFNDINFWDNTFNVIEGIMEEGKVAYIIIYSIYYIFYWIFYIAIFCLLITLFSKMRTMNYLRFWDLFKISVYSIAPFIICAVLSTLFNIGILIYIGYLIAAIYNIISVNEILKTLYITRKEGDQ